MNAFIAWLVGTMLVWVPVPEGQSPESVRVRYVAYAQDAVDVAFDASEVPLFKGMDGRAKTATLLLSIASLEGYYRADVDNGITRGDSGNSWCLMQVNTGGERVVMKGSLYGYASRASTQGWSGKDLVQDRQKCFRAALHIARESLQVCGNLSLYATGKCYRKGEPAGRLRLARAKEAFHEWWGRDTDVVSTSIAGL